MEMANLRLSLKDVHTSARVVLDNHSKRTQAANSQQQQQQQRDQALAASSKTSVSHKDSGWFFLIIISIMSVPPHLLVFCSPQHFCLFFCLCSILFFFSLNFATICSKLIPKFEAKCQNFGKNCHKMLLSANLTMLPAEQKYGQI